MVKYDKAAELLCSGERANKPCHIILFHADKAELPQAGGHHAKAFVHAERSQYSVAEGELSQVQKAAEAHAHLDRVVKTARLALRRVYWTCRY